MGAMRITELNIFLLPALIGAGILVAWRHAQVSRKWLRFRKFMDPVRRRRLAAATAVLFLLGCVYEAYYYVGQCRVSNAYREQNLRFLKATVGALERAGLQPWPHYGTLLAVVRDKHIIPWDHDSDWAIIVNGPEDEARWRAAIESMDAELIPDAKGRSMWQVLPRGTSVRFAPHADIWVWRRREGGEGGRGRYWVDDTFSTVEPELAHDDLFPFQRVEWNGVNISLPHRAHWLLSRELGLDFMVPRYSRSDCFHNFMNFRWAYLGGGEAR